jgi:hypothetical protein
MAQSTAELRHEIEQTRQDLGRDVDVINEKVSPGRIVHRNVERTRGAASSLIERVMGKASAATSGVTDRAGSAQSSIAGTLSDAPDAALRRTEGNPLAAGMVAFAAGWLAASVFPASRAEEHAAERLQDQAQNLKEPLKEQAAELGESMKGSVQDAAASLKESATNAAQAVADQGQSSAETLKDETVSSAQEIRGSGTSSSTGTA